jgi:uncharacterized protein (TIGR02594 family)
MKQTRRSLLLQAALPFIAPRSAWSAEAEWKIALRQVIASKDSITLGHIIPPPDDPSWTEAHAILDSAPVKAPPYMVAEYFKSSVPVKYQKAWPEPDLSHPTYANLVVMLFFLATDTRPAGDTTAWCSAFVNWCLQRSGISGTHNAGSQSFVNKVSGKTWGEEVWNTTEKSMPTVAKPGDIAIFRLQSDPAHGHVAFFRRISPTSSRKIEVIGGNQILGSGPNKLHLIDHASMYVFGEDHDLELISVKTAKGLRDA